MTSDSTNGVCETPVKTPDTEAQGSVLFGERLDVSGGWYVRILWGEDREGLPSGRSQTSSFVCLPLAGPDLCAWNKTIIIRTVLSSVL